LLKSYDFCCGLSEFPWPIIIGGRKGLYEGGKSAASSSKGGSSDGHDKKYIMLLAAVNVG